MLAKDRYLRLYDLHSWMGILFGFFIYVVAFTGTVALFYEEIKPWEDPSKRLHYFKERVVIQGKLEAFIDEHKSKGELVINRFIFPTESAPYYRIRSSVNDENDKNESIEEKWHSSTLELLPDRKYGLSLWLRNIHRNLMLPSKIGGALVGISGVLMLVLTITGILSHGRIVTDFFKLRFKRSKRLKWQDSHKVLGIFGLPFTIMISFTGALLGAVAILAPIVAIIAFQGDTEMLKAEMTIKPSEKAGVSALMISMDSIQNRVHPTSGVLPKHVVIRNYGDKNAEFRVVYEAQSGLKHINSILIDGVTGKVITPQKSIHSDTTANQIIDAMVPLHYATFGGISLKWVYAVLGIALCLMTASGTMLWVEKRINSNKSNRSSNFYKRVSQANIGICMGFPIATAAILYHDKIYYGPEIDRLYWTGVTYFTAAIGIFIISFFLRNGYCAVKIFSRLLGIMLLGAPLLNIITTGSTFWPYKLSTGELQSYLVDISILVIGIIVLFFGFKLKSGLDTKNDSNQSAV